MLDCEFDPEKSAKNEAERGLPFSLVDDFDFESAVIIEHYRNNEQRYRSFGELRGKLHCLVFTVRNNRIRVISLRRANKREEKRYGKEDQSRPR